MGGTLSPPLLRPLPPRPVPPPPPPPAPQFHALVSTAGASVVTFACRATALLLSASCPVRLKSSATCSIVCIICEPFAMLCAILWVGTPLVAPIALLVPRPLLVLFSGVVLLLSSLCGYHRVLCQCVATPLYSPPRHAIGVESPPLRSWPVLTVYRHYEPLHTIL